MRNTRTNQNFDNSFSRHWGTVLFLVLCNRHSSWHVLMGEQGHFMCMAQTNCHLLKPSCPFLTCILPLLFFHTACNAHNAHLTTHSLRWIVSPSYRCKFEFGYVHRQFVQMGRGLFNCCFRNYNYKSIPSFCISAFYVICGFSSDSSLSLTVLAVTVLISLYWKIGFQKQANITIVF